MPLGRVHCVLCVACRQEVTTLYAYEERRCGYTTRTRGPENGKLIHVSCTQGDGNKDCAQGVHYDRYVQLKFTAQGKLRSARSGETGHP